MAYASKAQGNAFEDLFTRLARLSGAVVTRIPDSCRRVGKKIIPIKSPWDFVLSYQGRSALIDTKTSQELTFRHSDITEHQAKELAPHCLAGVPAGYVIWLRSKDRVFFMPGSQLMEFLTTRGSFDESHPRAVFLGSIGRLDIRLIFATRQTPLNSLTLK